MHKEVLRLVTLLHPKDITAPAGLGDPRDLPHLTKSRAARGANQQKLAAERNLRPTQQRYVPGGIPPWILDFGEPDRKQQGSYYIQGACLSPYLSDYLSEPRLIHFQDFDRRFKWKLEFRTSWEYDLEGKLSGDQSKSVVDEISRCKLLIKALFLNRPLTPNAVDQVGVNLVLIPLKGPQEAQEMELCLNRSDRIVWIEW